MYLWNDIGTNIGIAPFPGESESSYAKRIVLSALSAWVHTAVYNSDCYVSVERIKSIIKSKYEAFISIDPVSFEGMPLASDLADYVHSILLSNGAFYHTPLYVHPASHRYIGDQQYSVIRGMHPDEIADYSGLAPIGLISSDCDINTGFHLQECLDQELIDTLWKSSASVSQIPTFIEYLNLNRKRYENYYSTKRSDTSAFTLARSLRETGGHEYYIVHNSEFHRLTDTATSASLHQYAALALMNSVQAQTVNVKRTHAGCHVGFGYLLPHPELNLVRYLSWPAYMPDYKDNYHFDMQLSGWQLLKPRILKLGYKVVESDE